MKNYLCMFTDTVKKKKKKIRHKKNPIKLMNVNPKRNAQNKDD